MEFGVAFVHMQLIGTCTFVKGVILAFVASWMKTYRKKDIYKTDNDQIKMLWIMYWCYIKLYS